MRCVVIHHHDEDGRAAAAVVKQAVKSRAKEFLFIEAKYDTQIPFDQLRNGDEVYVVDFSMQNPGDWARLCNIPRFPVTWIDHHITAIEAAKGTRAENLPGIREEGKRAGCALTWDFFYPDVEAPVAIQLISDRDTWTWERGEETAEFHAGLQMNDTSPESPLWTAILIPSECGTPSWVISIRSTGRSVLQYKNRFYGDLREKNAYEVEFEGNKAIAINVAGVGSEAFGFPNGYKGEMPDEWPVLIAFYYNGDNFVVSMYSKAVNVSEIAKKYGGGGHPGAAGFLCKNLPFSKK